MFIFLTTQKMMALHDEFIISSYYEHVNIEIKILQLKKKHFSKLILYKWSVAQLVIYNVNVTINITKK